MLDFMSLCICTRTNTAKTIVSGTRYYTRVKYCKTPYFQEFQVYVIIANLNSQKKQVSSPKSPLPHFDLVDD